MTAELSRSLERICPVYARFDRVIHEVKTDVRKENAFSSLLSDCMHMLLVSHAILLCHFAEAGSCDLLKECKRKLCSNFCLGNYF